MSLRIAAPNSNFYSPPPVKSPSLMGIENITVDYNSKGFANGLAILPYSKYDIACQSLPVDINFTGLKVKYSTESGDEYTGGSLNRFIVTLYKNKFPTTLSLNVDNVNSEAIVDATVWKKTTILRTDKWAVYIEPSPNSGESPTSGRGTWNVYLTY